MDGLILADAPSGKKSAITRSIRQNPRWSYNCREAACQIAGEPTEMKTEKNVMPSYYLPERLTRAMPINMRTAARTFPNPKSPTESITATIEATTG